jgi:DNA ligase 1
MKDFVALFNRLDQSNKTSDKLQALKSYFLTANDPDKMWTLALFTHRRPKRQVTTRLLREWCCSYAQIPDWLFEESYQTVGDLAETIALLLPLPSNTSDYSLSEWITWLMNLEGLEEEEKKERILTAWASLEKEERFIFTKLITGGFRVGVSQQLVVQALADVLEVEKTDLTHRLMGDWNPLKNNFHDLLLTSNQSDDLSRPYPFYLAHPVEASLMESEHPVDWQVEWKWDGIRGQLIKRNGEIFIWSRGEELVTEKFPELVEAASFLPDNVVLDGEILCFEGALPLPFGILQTRIGRKNLSKKILQEAPVSFFAYDLLELEGKDFRTQALTVRRAHLEELLLGIPTTRLQLSPTVEAESWAALEKIRESSRERMAEGFMLKRKNSSYEVGRKRGNWWKWKIDPLTIDGILIYAQKGHGRRADLFTDFTLAVWEGDKLVPFTKAYSGLTDAELKEADQYIKKNTVEKFGPVRTVKPGLVFEIAFEGIQESPRHKSGIALRFPRINRWRKDKNITEANTLADLKDLLSLYGG